MITYLFYLFICLFLIIFQTAILPNFSIFKNLYDLSIPFVLYLGLFRPFSEGLPIILLLGFVMDSISGVPFGLYLIAYLWLFIAMKWIIKFLHTESIFILPLAVVIGVLVENILLIVMVGVLEDDIKFLRIAIGNFSGQLLWVLLTGPFYLVFINFIHQKIGKWAQEFPSEKNTFGP